MFRHWSEINDQGDAVEESADSMCHICSNCRYPACGVDVEWALGNVNGRHSGVAVLQGTSSAECSCADLAIFLQSLQLINTNHLQWILHWASIYRYIEFGSERHPKTGADIRLTSSSSYTFTTPYLLLAQSCSFPSCKFHVHVCLRGSANTEHISKSIEGKYAITYFSALVPMAY